MLAGPRMEAAAAGWRGGCGPFAGATLGATGTGLPQPDLQACGYSKQPEKAQKNKIKSAKIRPLLV